MSSAPRIDHQELSGLQADALMLAVSLVSQILQGQVVGFVVSVEDRIFITPVPGIKPARLMRRLASADWTSVARLVKLELAKERL